MNPEESTLQALTEVRTLLPGLCWDRSTPAVSLSLSLSPEGDVRRPDPREDEGRQPGRGESEQHMCAELQGALVEQGPITRRP